ncbi:division/cell wall cluster transcriptional repressor MraZ [Novosphingobium sediminis]|uniref:division/cell wall cluster transcriptional repressor MraZ n=1 Tax=Novosphingobium sediminis TaxID=707214 RepID=UPI0011BF31D9|nr:division/cell wall cluster transcriptional repressor MraZ [Novosphingobium sediminis]
MAGAQSHYWGQGFSPRGEKNRFVLPSDFRQTVREASKGSRTLCLDKHHKHPCLVGFGESRADSFAEMLAHEERVAIERGEPFDMDLRAAQIGGFARISFDDSGRFVLPEYLGEQAQVGDALYFHGGMHQITIWAPDALFAMGSEWDSVKSACRARMAEFTAKASRK